MTIFAFYMLVALALLLIYDRHPSLTPLGKVVYSTAWPLWAAALIVPSIPPHILSEVSTRPANAAMVSLRAVFLWSPNPYRCWRRVPSPLMIPRGRGVSTPGPPPSL